MLNRVVELTTATAPSLSNHPDRPHDSSFAEGVASAGHDQPSNNNAPQQQPTLSEKDADNFDRDVLHRGVRDAIGVGRMERSWWKLGSGTTVGRT